MFVCHGNICRSPMAEFIFKDMLQKRKLTDRFYVSSCATSTEEIWNGIGNPVYPPAREELKKHGISCGEKRAVKLQKSDYEKYDYLICMDSRNIRNALSILGSDTKGKVSKLLDHTQKGGDVADPWYTGNFNITYHDISKGCEALLDELIKQYKR